MHKTRIGYLTRYSYEELEWAAKYGFGSVEILCWPGNALDPAVTEAAEIDRAARHMRDLGIEVSAVGYYPNMLDADLEKRQANIKHLYSVMTLAERLGAPVVGTFAGRVDPAKDVADSIPAFTEVFTPIARDAEKRNLKVAFENCPADHLIRGTRGGNIAYLPRGFDLMFAAVDSLALGIEYDPSHLVCLMMDYVDFIYRFGKRIYHVHAKDAEVNWNKVREAGVSQDNHGWCRHRTPGYGEVNFARMYSALIETGYEGNLDIEGLHDAVFNKERERQGLLFSLNHLRQVVYGQE